jgi:hypothetical protein
VRFRAPIRALKNYRQSRFTTDESKAFGGTTLLAKPFREKPLTKLKYISRKTEAIQNQFKKAKCHADR